MDDWDKFEYSSSKKTVTEGQGFVMHDAPPEETEPEAETAGSTFNAYDNYAPEDFAKPKKKKKSSGEPQYVTKKFFAVTLIIAMLFSAVIGAGAYALAMSTFGGTTIDKTVTTTNYNLAESTGSTLSVQEIVAKNENSVVAIVTESVSTDNWLGQYVTQGAGSGVIISEDGYIVTNNHVIEDASNIMVTLNDGTEASAKLVATDEQTDVAVIKIEKDGLTPVSFGDSDKLTVGELAIAIGNPLGEFAGSATEGIISGLEREITIDNKTMKLIQTSASINPGNSGGGLFDQYGNLVGVVVAKSSGSEVEGLGFAIPSNTVKEVADSLIENGYVTGRPAAGITIVDLTNAEDAMQYGVQLTGVYIQEVTGENAKKAGLKAGDLIYYLDDTKITSASQLVALIQSKEVGDKVTFTIVRDNRMVDVDVELVDSSTVNADDSETSNQNTQ